MVDYQLTHDTKQHAKIFTIQATHSVVEIAIFVFFCRQVVYTQNSDDVGTLQLRYFACSEAEITYTDFA